MKLTMAKGLGWGGPALSNPIKLVIGKQVVDSEKSFRSFFLLSSYDFHWKVKGYRQNC